ncbi:YueH family protein [Bacillus sp. WLY-B-L8]|uniref:YueH family protein n=1 Tax=Bacillus multifaciens TaxID=3068506 RepID=UPI0027428083|nr:YueH family protein [Bacillus sp. WLY-B-L8]MDP7981415.1 YueH family protein [Bacillus sp. WLY-B-L8]
MKKYDVTNENGSLNVYVEKIDETSSLVAIPRREWSYLIRYDVGTMYDYECDHNEIVRSLFHKAGFSYEQAEKIADLIEEWINF